MLKGVIWFKNILVTKEISYRNFLIISIFILLLYSPFIYNISGIKIVDSSEQRTLIKKTIVNINSLASFPNRYEKYFDDNFGLKNELIELNNILHVKLLGVSPVDKVTIGKNGWLFYSFKIDGDPCIC